MEQCESLNEKLFPPSAEGPTNCPFPKKSEEPEKGRAPFDFEEALPALPCLQGACRLPCAHERDQTLKEDPQPQVVTALGLSITNCSPERPSL